MNSLPYGRHTIDEDDIEAVVEVLRGDWITQGPLVDELEGALADRCGARHAVVCSSGTAALHLAMLAAGVGPGDEIIAPAITFLATANCGAYTGAVPVFTDVEPASGHMTASTLEPALSSRTKAVLPVHLTGLPCNMEALTPLIRERAPQAVIVEDACHALGGQHRDGTMVGALSWADMVMFSFHPVKHIAAGEGGAILTDRDDLAGRLRRLRSHGTTRDPAMMTRPTEGPWYYEMVDLGFNYRLPDMNCALALSQLEKLDRFVARRRELAALYHVGLASLPSTVLPLPREVSRSAWHIYCLRIDFEGLGKTRKEVMEELRRWGVGTQVHYFPVPLQPWYRERFGYEEGQFPGAEHYYGRTLTIPLYPSLSDGDARRVIDSLHQVLGE